MKKFLPHLIKFLLISMALFLTAVTFIRVAFAFPVSPLPGDNFIQNPWFRDPQDPTSSGLNGWIDAAGPNHYWSTSQKESNPSPDLIASGLCDPQPSYCGTAARLSPTPGQSGGIGKLGVDAYLYQVVPANASSLKLKFFTHWVSHRIDPAEVTIYGGPTPSGPWVEVWVPFYHQQDQPSPPPEGDIWAKTDMLEKTLEQGYNYYKIEVHARLPEGEQVGFKITGVYFTTDPPLGGSIQSSLFIPLLRTTGR